MRATPVDLGEFMANATATRPSRRRTTRTEDATAAEPEVRRGRRTVPEEQLAEDRAIRSYLNFMERRRTRARLPIDRGRLTLEQVDEKLADLERRLPSASPITRLQLIQERLDLVLRRQHLTADQEPDDESDLEDAFVKHAAGYSARKGISAEAWRQMGVNRVTLRRAGLL
jgi:hypothetical protein